MPGKLIIALIAAGITGAAAIAGVSLALSSGGAAPAAERDAPPEDTLPTDQAAALPVSFPEEGKPALSGSRSDVVINPDDFGAAPDLDMPAEVSGETGSRWGIGKEKLPPPPARACVTKDEFNEAMLGTGCDCSCDGYAAQVSGPASSPASGQCDVACGIAWYVCWAPDPSEKEIDDAALATLDGYEGETRVMMEAILREHLASPEGRAGNRGAMMADRAFTWNDARMCVED